MGRVGEEHCGGCSTPTWDSLQETGGILKETLDISFEIRRMRRIYPAEKVWTEEVKGVHAQECGMERVLSLFVSETMSV